MRRSRTVRTADGSTLRRKTGAFRGSKDPVLAGVFLAENPNRGKRHAARMTDAFLQELAEAESRAYSPLTVSHPTLDRIGRRNPRFRTSYTV